MEKIKRIILYGKSIILETLKASLAKNHQFEVISVISSLPKCTGIE